MDTIYRIFMFILPYAIVVAAYLWIGKKLWRLPASGFKIIGMILFSIGILYTVYDLVMHVRGVLVDDRFNVGVLLINVVIMALTSIAIAIAEPEETSKVKK